MTATVAPSAAPASRLATPTDAIPRAAARRSPGRPDGANPAETAIHRTE